MRKSLKSLAKVTILCLLLSFLFISGTSGDQNKIQASAEMERWSKAETAIDEFFNPVSEEYFGLTIDTLYEKADSIVGLMAKIKNEYSEKNADLGEENLRKVTLIRIIDSIFLPLETKINSLLANLAIKKDIIQDVKKEIYASNNLLAGGILTVLAGLILILLGPTPFGLAIAVAIMMANLNWFWSPGKVEESHKAFIQELKAVIGAREAAIKSIFLASKNDYIAKTDSSDDNQTDQFEPPSSVSMPNETPDLADKLQTNTTTPSQAVDIVYLPGTSSDNKEDQFELPSVASTPNETQESANELQTPSTTSTPNQVVDTKNLSGAISDNQTDQFEPPSSVSTPNETQESANELQTPTTISTPNQVVDIVNSRELFNKAMQDDSESLRLLSESGERGEPESQFLLGELFRKGSFPDHSQALLWYMRAAENNNGKALIEIIDYAYTGDLDCQKFLGKQYLEGKIIEIDFAKAISWYNRAAAQGDPEAQISLAKVLLAQRSPQKQQTAVVLLLEAAKKEPQKAIQVITEYAMLGDIRCQYFLGKHYFALYEEFNKDFLLTLFHRPKLDKMLENSFFWLSKAAEKNYRDANLLLIQVAETGTPRFKRKLGNLFFEGKRFKKNTEEAVKWYTRAAKDGDINAQYYLALAHLKGEGIAQNISEAIKWLKKAADNGHKKALDDLQKLRNSLNQ